MPMVTCHHCGHRDFVASDGLRRQSTLGGVVCKNCGREIAADEIAKGFSQSLILGWVILAVIAVAAIAMYQLFFAQ